MHAHTALSARAFRHEGFQESAGGAWCCLAPCHSEVVEVATGGTEPVCKHPWARGRASWRRKKPRLLRAAAVLELSEVADSTSALSECFKVFLSIE